MLKKNDWSSSSKRWLKAIHLFIYFRPLFKKLKTCLTVADARLPDPVDFKKHIEKRVALKKLACVKMCFQVRSADLPLGPADDCVCRMFGVNLAPDKYATSGASAGNTGKSSCKKVSGRTVIYKALN